MPRLARVTLLTTEGGNRWNILWNFRVMFVTGSPWAHEKRACNQTRLQLSSIKDPSCQKTLAPRAAAASAPAGRRWKHATRIFGLGVPSSRNAAVIREAGLACSAAHDLMYPPAEGNFHSWYVISNQSPIGWQSGSQSVDFVHRLPLCFGVWTLAMKTDPINLFLPL